jgi:hypothetical protein
VRRLSSASENRNYARMDAGTYAEISGRLRGLLIGLDDRP